MDKTTKLLLALIAIGLWANVAAPLVHPTPAKAQGLDDIYSRMDDIASDVRKIARGTCTNGKLC